MSTEKTNVQNPEVETVKVANTASQSDPNLDSLTALAVPALTSLFEQPKRTMRDRLENVAEIGVGVAAGVGLVVGTIALINLLTAKSN